MASALSLFAERGFDRTSVLQIARGAGVSEAAFYWYFAAKDEVVVALIAEAKDQLKAAASRVARLPGPSGEKAIAALGEWQTILAANRTLWRVAQARALNSPAVRRADHAARGVIAKLLARLIEQGLRSGSVRTGASPKIAAVALMATAEYAYLDPSTRDDPTMPAGLDGLMRSALASGE